PTWTRSLPPSPTRRWRGRRHSSTMSTPSPSTCRPPAASSTRSVTLKSAKCSSRISARWTAPDSADVQVFGDPRGRLLACQFGEEDKRRFVADDLSARGDQTAVDDDVLGADTRLGELVLEVCFPASIGGHPASEIGRASCRERVWMSAVEAQLKKKR